MTHAQSITESIKAALKLKGAARNEALYEVGEQATIRVEGMLHLGCVLCADTSEPDLLDDLLDEGRDEGNWKRLLKQMGADARAIETYFDDEEIDWEAFKRFAHKHKVYGFLVEVATPVMKGTGYSWGHYRTAWFYAETVEDALLHAGEWAAEVQARDLSAGSKKAKASK